MELEGETNSATVDCLAVAGIEIDQALGARHVSSRRRSEAADGRCDQWRSLPGHRRIAATNPDGRHRDDALPAAKSPRRAAAAGKRGFAPLPLIIIYATACEEHRRPTRASSCGSLSRQRIRPCAGMGHRDIGKPTRQQQPLLQRGDRPRYGYENAATPRGGT